MEDTPKWVVYEKSIYGCFWGTPILGNPRMYPYIWQHDCRHRPRCQQCQVTPPAVNTHDVVP